MFFYILYKSINMYCCVLWLCFSFFCVCLFSTLIDKSHQQRVKSIEKWSHSARTHFVSSYTMREKYYFVNFCKTQPNRKWMRNAEFSSLWSKVKQLMGVKNVNELQMNGKWDWIGNESENWIHSICEWLPFLTPKNK